MPWAQLGPRFTYVLLMPDCLQTCGAYAMQSNYVFAPAGANFHDVELIFFFFRVFQSKSEYWKKVE